VEVDPVNRPHYPVAGVERCPEALDLEEWPLAADSPSLACTGRQQLLDDRLVETWAKGTGMGRQVRHPISG
jgi:hypothetical protein